MPLPKDNENKSDYISRCVKELIDKEGKPQKQALAICYSYWDKHQENNENLSYINCLDSENMIYEATESEHANRNIDVTKLLTRDQPSIGNKIRGWKVRGIIITDSFNNPFFPVQNPRLDTTKFWLPKIQKQLRTYYAAGPLTYTPWHFHVEILGNAQYFVFNTRPLDSKFPLSTKDAEDLVKSNGIELNDVTQKFFESKPFELEDAIHINIVGDSSFDVYTYDLYKTVGRMCIGPILRYFKLPRKMYQKVFPLQMGSKFNPDILDQYLQR